MSRISFPTPDNMTPEQRRVYESIIAGPRGRLVGPLRAALHNPELADRWQKLGALLRYSTSLPERLTELAILVTARRWNSQIEWYIHADAARKAGLGETVIRAIQLGEAPAFDDKEEAAVYEFARQLQQSGNVSDTVYQRVRERWLDLGVVELAAVIGYYTMVSMTLNVHHIPMPDEGVEPPLKPVVGTEQCCEPGVDAGLTSLPPASRCAKVRP